MTPIKVGRFGTRNMYLGPNRSAPAMRLPAAKAACSQVAALRAELDEEIAYGKDTGLGDHGKVTRLIDAIHAATGRMPWENTGARI